MGAAPTPLGYYAKDQPLNISKLPPSHLPFPAQSFFSYNMDSFEKLPPEVIQQILANIGDFAGIENSLLASRRLNAVFQAQPTRIIQELILLIPITCMPEIQKLCYNIGHLSISSLQCPDLEHYHQTCEDPPTLGYTESRHILKIGAQIQRLACKCLSIMREGLIKTLDNIPADSISGPPLQIQNASQPFTWTEEYRTYWALWHLHHYSHLRKAATQRWNWNESSIRELDAYNTWSEIDYRTAERLWTVSAVLSDLGLTLNWLPNDPEAEEPAQTIWPAPEETSIPFFPSFDLPPTQSQDSSLWATPDPPEDTELTSTWMLAPRHRASHHWHVAHLYLSGINLTRTVPACYSLTNMKPWRRLGWVIWDGWRMYSIGLSNIARKKKIPLPDGGFLEPEPRNPRDRKPGIDYVARWFAMVGEEKP